jgi:hypothetical protein
MKVRARVNIVALALAAPCRGAAQAPAPATQPSEAEGGTGKRSMFTDQEDDLPLGADVAHGPEDWAYYITIGTGWLRD